MEFMRITIIMTIGANDNQELISAKGERSVILVVPTIVEFHIGQLSYIHCYSVVCCIITFKLGNHDVSKCFCAICKFKESETAVTIL